MALTGRVLFRSIVAERFVPLPRIQKTKCRAPWDLSNGIHLTQIYWNRADQTSQKRNTSRKKLFNWSNLNWLWIKRIFPIKRRAISQLGRVFMGCRRWGGRQSIRKTAELRSRGAEVAPRANLINRHNSRTVSSHLLTHFSPCYTHKIKKKQGPTCCHLKIDYSKNFIFKNLFLQKFRK